MLNKVEVVLKDIIDNRKEVLPIGEQPEGNLDPLGKLEAVMKSLFKNIDLLKENINKLKAENQKLKDALGIVTTEEDSHGH